jgi:AcrR family transcriptional regulator
MAEKIQDRRIKRTQRLLAQALIELTLAKGYESVTIRDITNWADVGYATFFRHYRDKDALLQHLLQEVLDELLHLLRPQTVAVDSAEVGTLLFRYVQEHNEVCRVLLSSRGSLNLVQQMIEAGTRNMLQQHAPLAGSPVPAAIAAHHVVASSISLIEWWLAHEMPHPPEQMGVIYYELIMRPVYAVAFHV